MGVVKAPAMLMLQFDGSWRGGFGGGAGAVLRCASTDAVVWEGACAIGALNCI